MTPIFHIVPQHLLHSLEMTWALLMFYAYRKSWHCVAEVAEVGDVVGRGCALTLLKSALWPPSIMDFDAGMDCHLGFVFMIGY